MTETLPIPNYLSPMSLSTPTICMLGGPGRGGGNSPTSHMQCTPGVTSAEPGDFPIYPPPHNVNDDEHFVFTYGSFQENLNISLSSWSLRVQIPIPEIKQPTLLGLNYMIKYATTFDTRHSTIQTDTILTTQTLPEGILALDFDFSGVYKLKDSTGIRVGYRPLMVDHEKALRLSTSLSIKPNGRDENWNHYIDNQYITPKVSVESGAGVNLYVVFHVCEYPSVKTARNLYVEVSAIWKNRGVNRKAREEEKRKREEEAIKAQFELERRTREGEERKARKEEKEWNERERRMRGEERTARVEERTARVEERTARVEERMVRVEEKLWRDADKVWKDADMLWKEGDQSTEAVKLWKEERQARPKNETGAEAGPAMQKRIDKKMAELNKTCSSGLPFERMPWGYQCTGGKHSVTFEELGI